MTTQHLLLLLILLPVSHLPFLYMARNNPNLREGISFAVGLINAILVISMVSRVWAQETLAWEVLPLLPGVSLSLRLDPLGCLLLLTAGLLWPLATIYSAGYMRGYAEKNQTRFFSLFGAAIACTNGVAVSGNLLTLYLFYELLSLSTYGLVGHHQDEEGRSASRRYLAFLVGGSIGLALPAMAIVYTLTGSLEFGNVHLVLAGGGLSAAFLTLAFVYGFAKAGIMPMHAWLPGAMVAPTPVSSLLHAVAVVKVGVFAVSRSLCDVLGPRFLTEHNTHHLVTAICLTTILVSAALMLSQDNLKRCLAFSTIGHLSYIVLGMSLLNRSGLAAGSMHILMHGVGKITLFFCAGAIACHTHKKAISEFNGLGRVMPWTFAAFTLGCLSIIGLPPTGGFLSKWWLVVGSLEGGMPVVAGAILVASLLKAWTFFPIIFRAFYLPFPEEDKAIKGDCSWLMRLPLMITAIGSVLLFFFPGYIMGLAQMYADQVLTRGGF